MCIPLAVAATAATVGGSLLSAGGQLSAGSFNARMARRQAQTADRAAADAEARGQQDAEAIRRVFADRQGQQVAGLAAVNVDVASGSAANLVADTGMVGELETLRVMNNAAREAYGFRSQAQALRAEATMARRSAALGAATTLLAGASQAGTGWAQMRGRT
jgi:hypothetical protein